MNHTTSTLPVTKITPAGVRRRRPCARRGGTIVEFAIVAPILFLVMFTCMEFARMNMIRNSAENAAYEAARAAIVPGATADDARDTGHAVLDAVLTSGEQITITPPVIAPETQVVTVTVEVPLDDNSWVAPVFFAGTTIEASCTLRRDLVETVTVP